MVPSTTSPIYIAVRAAPWLRRGAVPRRPREPGALGAPQCLAAPPRAVRGAVQLPGGRLRGGIPVHVPQHFPLGVPRADHYGETSPTRRPPHRHTAAPLRRFRRNARAPRPGALPRAGRRGRRQRADLHCRHPVAAPAGREAAQLPDRRRRPHHGPQPDALLGRAEHREPVLRVRPRRRRRRGRRQRAGLHRRPCSVLRQLGGRPPELQRLHPVRRAGGGGGHLHPADERRHRLLRHLHVRRRGGHGRHGDRPVLERCGGPHARSAALGSAAGGHAITWPRSAPSRPQA